MDLYSMFVEGVLFPILAVPMTIGILTGFLGGIQHNGFTDISLAISGSLDPFMPFVDSYMQSKGY